VTTKAVYIFSPGGVAAKGGIGRIVTILTRRLGKDTDIPHRVVDTYGPRVNLPGSQKWMPFYFTAAALRLLAVCLIGRIGLAHIHMSSHGSILRKGVLLLVCDVFGIHAIVHIHGGNLDQFCARRGIGLSFLRFAFRRVTQVVALGEYWRQLVVTWLEVDPSRVCILPNAIAAPPEPQPRMPTPECELIFLGHATPEKGMDDLLAALGSADLVARRWRLTIVGAGEIERYRSVASELGIGARISFLGWVSETEIPVLLGRADILVLPSHFECLPMSIIEAMAHGLPVVATAVGAVPDAVVDGETGLLVPPEAPSDLGQAIARLIDDPGERLRLGRNGRRRFSAKFELEEFHGRMRAMYLQHLPRPRAFESGI
jgi:glycosyltransferase involved in cell wall biosynthesis